MNNFTYSIPTTVHFGKNQISHLTELSESGSKALLVYGGGSIKRSGLFGLVEEILNQAGIEVFELSGIQPNPRIDSVRAGVDICKKNGIDMVLAIGGGSVIDCAKVIAAGAVYDGDPWALVMDPEKINVALPIYCVLTLAATGSEMDHRAVITNPEISVKKGTKSPHLNPKMSIMDPEFTYTVPPRQTAAGTADILSHAIESYFTTVPNADVQAGFAEGLMKTVIKYGPVVMNEPDNYDARANLMWASSFAMNGLLMCGAEIPWSVHPMQYELAGVYDINHGEGLAVLLPHWMRAALNEETAEKFAAYGRNVWELNGDDDMVIGEEAIECTKVFFRQLGLPETLRDLGIHSDELFEEMAARAAVPCSGGFVSLNKEDILEIFKKAL